MSRQPLAKVWITAKNFEIPVIAIVMDQPLAEVIVGRDIGPVLDELLEVQ